MNVRCRYWSQSKEYHDRGNCSKGIKELPDYTFCVGHCRFYHEPDLPQGQRTIEKEKDQTKINDFLAAQKDLFTQGRVSKEIAEHRLTTCTGITVEGKQVNIKCMHYSGDLKSRGDGTCGACGCKAWKISQMKVKVYYPIGCPINRFSPMPGRRVKINDDNSGTRPQSKTE